MKTRKKVIDFKDLVKTPAIREKKSSQSSTYYPVDRILSKRSCGKVKYIRCFIDLPNELYIIFNNFLRLYFSASWNTGILPDMIDNIVDYIIENMICFDHYYSPHLLY